MKYPFEIPANSFIENYSSNKYGKFRDETRLMVRWKNIDTGEIIEVKYPNDFTEYTKRCVAEIMEEQMEALTFVEYDARIERLREMARERA